MKIVFLTSLIFFILFVCNYLSKVTVSEQGYCISVSSVSSDKCRYTVVGEEL